MPNNFSTTPVVYQTTIDVLTAEDVKDTDLGNPGRMIMVHPDLDNDELIGVKFPSGREKDVFVWECRYGNVIARTIISATSTADLTKVRLHI